MVLHFLTHFHECHPAGVTAAPRGPRKKGLKLLLVVGVPPPR